MSYCRFSEGDVYVTQSTDGEWTCFSCRLVQPEGSQHFRSLEEVWAHLEAHKAAGHKVPWRAFALLAMELAGSEAGNEGLEQVADDQSEHAFDVLQPPSTVEEGENMLSTPTSMLELSVRAKRALQKGGVATLGQLTSLTEADLLALRGSGQLTVDEIKRLLERLGLSLQQGRLT